MTEREFRTIALRMPETSESAHVGHPDFRVHGRVFATLRYPAKGWGMVKLTPHEQRAFMKAAPGVFHLANGAWGRQGCTTVELRSARGPEVRRALLAAWRQAMAKRR